MSEHDLTNGRPPAGKDPARHPFQVAVGLAGLAFGLCAESAFARGRPSTATLVENVAVGWAFMGAGLVAWRRRPHNRLGPLLIAEGFAWFLRNFQASGIPLVFSVALWLDPLEKAVLVHLILAFPDGRLSSRIDRLAVRACYVVVGVLGLLRVVTFYPPSAGCPGCTTGLVLLRGRATNALLLFPSDPLHRGIMLTFSVVGALLALVILGIVVNRWRSSSGPTRRLLTPVWLSAAIWMLLAARAGGAAMQLLSQPASTAIESVTSAAQLALPLVFLAGLLRTRLARGTVGELLVEVGRRPRIGELQDAIARTLRDPSCCLAFWRPDLGGYVDPEGQPVELPADAPKRVVSLVGAEGRPTAVMIHDAALAEEPELVGAVAAAARLRLENERLQAEARARLDTARASQARIVEAADAARRRVERDLHDGAQQRLIALSMTLSVARSQLGESSHAGLGSLGTTLTRASEEVGLALEELRELARGIHPAVLSQGGLAPAVESLAERAPLPVEQAVVRSRYKPVTEATAYFVICEALANAVRHAHASVVRIGVREVRAWGGGWLLVEVVDDGIGGADPDRGSGLRGLADRVDAVGGRLTITSPAGRGTRIEAGLPCG